MYGLSTGTHKTVSIVYTRVFVKWVFMKCCSTVRILIYVRVELFDYHLFLSFNKDILLIHVDFFSL